MMKTIDRLDDGSAQVIARSPVAGSRLPGRRRELRARRSSVARPGFAERLVRPPMSLRLPSRRSRVRRPGASRRSCSSCPASARRCGLPAPSPAERRHTVVLADERGVGSLRQVHPALRLWEPALPRPTSPPSTPGGVRRGRPVGRTRRPAASSGRARSCSSRRWTPAVPTHAPGRQPGFIQVLDGSDVGDPGPQGKQAHRHLPQPDGVRGGVARRGHPRAHQVLHLAAPDRSPTTRSSSHRWRLGGSRPHAALVVRVDEADVRTIPASRPAGCGMSPRTSTSPRCRI